jgi:NAD(P)-dependent dehydrogenase (short-subunit alcohol dehydrogenase family)
VAATLSCFGRLDAVVTLVGHWEPGKEETTPDERWHGVLDTNLHSIFYTLREAAPHVSPGGSIVLMGAEEPVEGKGGQVAYAVSKAGVHTLTKSLALELKPRQVRVNALLPRNIDTPDNRRYRPEGDFSKWVQPRQIAEIILFLVCPVSAPITGALIPVNGME